MRLGTAVHGLGLEALVAVTDQRLVNRRRQAVAIALLGGIEGIGKVGALLRPAGDLVELVEAVCPDRRGADHHQQ
ncbi:hypothetical protein D3C75_1040940 [compost metagenome]